MSIENQERTSATAFIETQIQAAMGGRGVYDPITPEQLFVYDKSENERNALYRDMDVDLMNLCEIDGRPVDEAHYLARIEEIARRELEQAQNPLEAFND